MGLSLCSKSPSHLPHTLSHTEGRLSLNDVWLLQMEGKQDHEGDRAVEVSSVEAISKGSTLQEKNEGGVHADALKERVRMNCFHEEKERDNIKLHLVHPLYFPYMSAHRLRGRLD